MGAGRGLGLRRLSLLHFDEDAMSDAPRAVLHVDARYLSPYAMSAFVALQEKGLPCTLEPVDLNAGAQHAAPYAETSLTRRVPTLVLDGFALSESSAIAEYLEDTVPGPRLYPADPRQRARARQIQAWLRSDLGALRQERPTEVVFLGATMPALSAAGRAAADKLALAAAELLRGGAEGTLFGGWCLADTDLALMLRRLSQDDGLLPPTLADYARRQWQRPSVQAWARLGAPV